MPKTESTAVTRLIELAQQRPIDVDVDWFQKTAKAQPEVTQVVRRRPRGIVIGAGTVVGAFLAGMITVGVVYFLTREHHHPASQPSQAAAAAPAAPQPIVAPAPPTAPVVTPSAPSAPVVTPVASADPIVTPVPAPVPVPAADSVPAAVPDSVPATDPVPVPAAVADSVPAADSVADPDPAPAAAPAAAPALPRPHPTPTPTTVTTAATHRVATAAHPPPPKPTPTGSAWLMVGTKPPCKLYIDGTLVGWTPQRKVPLRPGRHQLRLINADQHVDRRLAVDAPAGGTVRLIRDFTE